MIQIGFAKVELYLNDKKKKKHFVVSRSFEDFITIF